MPLRSLLININVFLLNKVLIYFFKKLTETIPWKHTHIDIIKKISFMKVHFWVFWSVV